MSEDSEEKWTTVYVVELEPKEDPHARWYVGMTEDPERRFREHENRNGSEFTKRNDVIETYVVGHTTDGRFAKRLEDQITLCLMYEYGRRAVRGGKYSRSSTRGDHRNRTKAHMPPGAKETLQDSDCEALQKIAESTGYTIEVPQRLKFKNEDEMIQWADRTLPEGTEVSVDDPLSAKSRTYVVDPEHVEGSRREIDHGTLVGIRSLDD